MYLSIIESREILDGQSQKEEDSQLGVRLKKKRMFLLGREDGGTSHYSQTKPKVNNLIGNFTIFTSMGEVVESSATLMEISTGLLVLGSVAGANTSLISLICVFSIIGERSVAFITATLSATFFLPLNCNIQN